MIDDLELDQPDPNGEALLGALRICREHGWRPLALVCPSMHAGRAAPYAAMYDLELVVEDTATSVTLRYEGEAPDLGDEDPEC